jgi:phage-related minor tail protein
MSVNKTTLYLPDELKRTVARIAAASGKSEASVIREAIGALARTAERPRPCGGVFRSGDPTLSASAEGALAGFGER